MTGYRRTGAAFSVIVAVSGVTTLHGRRAAGAEPTTAECLASYEDAVNLKRTHQMRATLAKLTICSSESCPSEVRGECLRLVPEIGASIPTVVFEVRDAAGTNLVAVKVTMDGDVLAERLDGSALSIDPGEHTFAFEAAGRPRVEKRLVLWEGDKLRRERVELEALAAPKLAAPPPITVTKPLAEPSPPHPDNSKPSWSKARIVGLVVGGVGVAATGVGIAYGLIAMSRRNEANGVCPAQCADQTLWNSARSAGNVATGALIVGAVGIASGVVIWLRTRPASDVAPGAQVGLGPGGLLLRGRW
jgi:hypothetical protein